MQTSQLELDFHREMLNVYLRAKDEIDYIASYFLQMVNEQGGLKAARILLWKDSPSDGFTILWENKRLDLTVECVILKPQFQDLFTEEEREIARNRLADYGCADEECCKHGA